MLPPTDCANNVYMLGAGMCAFNCNQWDTERVVEVIQCFTAIKMLNMYDIAFPFFPFTNRFEKLQMLQRRWFKDDKAESLMVFKCC